MPPSQTNPFALGVYVGNPDNSSPAGEAAFESRLASFSSALGGSPQYYDTFVDQTQPTTAWVGNSRWAASSAASSLVARSLTPVIALPLSSSAAGSPSADQAYRAFASGQNDGVLRGVIDAWAAQGFSSLYVRPGWEMNIQGPTFAGADSQIQADWVAAFQHVYAVLHQEAAAKSVSLQVVWNPSVTNYAPASATGALYPGAASVDVIGADVYSNIYPYSDGGSPATYHDWDTGLEDSSVAQFIADPVNRTHYWTWPAATKWSLDGSLGHSTTLSSLIRFAQQQGKPFAIPETGAGATQGGVDVADDAAFPAWLGQTLTQAQAAGEKIDFVNLWDSNGGGSYEFSQASDGKPAESAAWKAAFGAYAPEQTVGAGAADIVLDVSEDAYLGDARFTVAVDGAQVGGTLTAGQSHAAGRTQAFDVRGDFAAGTHRVTVRFLNDAYGGPGLDRNLYVDSVAYGGATVQTAAALTATGAKTFGVAGAGQAPDTLTLKLSEDAWQGDARFTVGIDGTTLGAARSVAARHGAGSQTFTFSGDFGPGPHAVAVTFLNDAYGGPGLDRNLYVDGVSVNGVSGTPATAALLSAGTAGFTVAAPPPAKAGHAVTVQSVGLAARPSFVAGPAASTAAPSAAAADWAPAGADPAPARFATGAAAGPDWSAAAAPPRAAVLPDPHAGVSAWQSLAHGQSGM